MRREIPPAAAPLTLGNFAAGLRGILAGKALDRIRGEFMAYFGVEHVFLVSSGKGALALILAALRSLSGRKKVVVPAYTCFSVPSAVVKAGCEVVPCDVDEETFGIRREELEGLLGEDVLAVVQSHLFGIPADVARIAESCADSGAFLVEDAAQAMGVDAGGARLGTAGDVGFYSLGRGKNISCGSGGIIVTRSGRIARAIERHYRRLSSEPLRLRAENALACLATILLIDPRLYWIPAKMPFLGLGETRFYRDFPIHGIDGFRAGVLSGWKKALERSNRKRAANGRYFRNALPGFGPAEGNDEAIPYLRFPVRLRGREDKDRLLSTSRRLGLGISGMYPAPVHRIPEIRDMVGGYRCPASERICDTLVTLPTHERLEPRDRERIVTEVRRLWPWNMSS